MDRLHPIPLHPSLHLTPLPCTPFILFSSNLSDELQKVRERNLQSAMNQIGVVPCPYPNCGGGAIPSQTREGECIKCDCCGYSYCSKCQEKYHYRVSCEDFRVFTRDWTLWCTRNRKQFYHQIEKKYQRQMNHYNQHVNKVEMRNKKQKNLYEERVGDEEWKSKNCRICPNCSRPVQHLGGCSSMICGTDYHGGNTQNGCGHSFNWEQALPYTANAKPMREVSVKLSVPQLQVLEQEHVGFICDMCGKEIVGLRFSCLNCPHYSLCQRCEVEFMKHDQFHIFQIFGLD
eukprot:TRINITY_DN264_c0_g1_i12.p1 TRINITY_DN264_c0_g1~~TRINITY_DN264_c0_g1_i12.p1  ORF type:complete len:288 (-),score=30.75 TRINITY_DN264_c0_g1_i12:108-971(-)